MSLESILRAAVALLLLSTGPVLAQDTLARVTSPHAHAETVQRLEKAIEARGLVLLSKVDHAAAARKAGLKLRPTVLLIFGNPKGGTPLMQAEPTVGIDLPMKALVWQGDDGKVEVAVNLPAFYERHGLTAQQREPLEAAKGLVEAALRE